VELHIVNCSISQVLAMAKPPRKKDESHHHDTNSA